MKRTKLTAVFLSGLFITAGVIGAAPAQAVSFDTATNVVKTEDTLPAVEPTILSPLPDSTFEESSFSMNGTGQPGATIVLEVGGTRLPELTVAENGSWSVFVENVPLGKFNVDLVQSKSGYNSFGLNIDLLNFSLAATGPAAGSTVETQTPTFTGYGAPDRFITVKDSEGQIVCETMVTGDGTWSCTSEVILPYGSTTVTILEKGVGERTVTAPTFILAEAEATPLVAPALGAGAVVALLAGALVVFARRRATAGI